MNELHVYDVSPMIYVGSTGKNEMYYGVPVGGIRFFLDHFAVAMVGGDSIVPCFDSPNFRNDLLPQYKAGRLKDPGIYYQLDVIYRGMQRAGVACAKREGYEADDLIEWVVNDLEDSFIRGVFIHTNDMDVCHSIRNGVDLISIGNGVHDVTWSSFEKGIYRGKIVRYNTISAYKVIFGCKSDNIPAFKPECGIPLEDLYTGICGVMSNYGNLGDRAIGPNPRFFIAICQALKFLTDNDKKELEKRVKLIYPAEKPDDWKSVATSWRDVDKSAIENLCNKYGARKALQCLNFRQRHISEQEKDELRKDSHALGSGEYAADKNLKFENKKVRSSLIELDSFTRAFKGD